MMEVANVFDKLEEREAIVYELEENNDMKEGKNKVSFFQGDIEVYSDSEIIIVDKVANKVYYLKDRSVVDFIKRFEDFIFNKLPEINIGEKEFEVDFEGYTIHVRNYGNELGVSKTEVSRVIKRFVYKNYAVKKGNFRIEIEKKDGTLIVRGDTDVLKEVLKKLGFSWNKDKKEWEKKGTDEKEEVKKVLKEVDF